MAEEVKKTTKKTAPVKKTVTAEVKAKEAAPKAAKKAEGTLTVSLYNAEGKETGTVTLPESIFGAKINDVLMAQAVRVYLANQRMGAANTKSRGEVDGSTRKIYRQKGTGRARHGGVRAPIFVGGGIAHGPKAKDHTMSLPTKMRRAALLSALSSMAKEGNIKVVAGLETAEGKTKAVAKLLSGMGLADTKAMLVMPTLLEKVWKAARNVEKLEVRPAAMLTTYEVLNAGTLVIMKEALDTFGKPEGK